MPKKQLLPPTRTAPYAPLPRPPVMRVDGPPNRQPMPKAAERPHQQVFRPAGPRPSKRIEQTRQDVALISWGLWRRAESSALEFGPFSGQV